MEQLTTLMEFYGDGRNELHGGFNFVFINAALEAEAMRRVVEDTEALLPEGAWPIWTGSNHDVSRLATRWAGGDLAKVRCALLILLTLRGTPFLYQGDEIGLTDGPIEQSDLHDAVGIRFWPYYKGRDPERTPMPWSNTPGGGFTSPGVTPWLPMGDPARVQRGRPGGRPRLRPGLHPPGHRRAGRTSTTWPSAPTARCPRPPAPGPTPGATGRWWPSTCRSGPQPVEAYAGTIALSTERTLEGTAVEGALTLAPWTGVVITS